MKTMKRPLALTSLAFLLAGCAQVDTGYRGVVLHWSKPTGETINEGLYLQNPFIGQSIAAVNVQIQSVELEASAVSHDLQKVDTKVTINYHLDPNKVVEIYDSLRNGYGERIIAPTVQESVKAATASFTAGDLIVRRAEVKNSIDRSLALALKPYGIIVDQVLITDFEFSKDFADAVEAKVTAQQELITVQTKAQSAIQKAEGEARAQALQRQTLTPLMVQLKWIEKWDGRLPSVTGNQIPMMQIPVPPPAGPTS